MEREMLGSVERAELSQGLEVLIYPISIKRSSKDVVKPLLEGFDLIADSSLLPLRFRISKPRQTAQQYTKT